MEQRRRPPAELEQRTVTSNTGWRPGRAQEALTAGYAVELLATPAATARRWRTRQQGDAL